MHEIRSIVVAGEKRQTLAFKKAPAATDNPRNGGLAGIAIRREEARMTNQRREDRHVNLVEKAKIVFRRKRLEVDVLNVSSHGAMLRSDIEARVGERVDICFEGCNLTQGSVRWIKGSRIGLEFANETVMIASADVRELIVSGRRPGEEPTPDIEKKHERAHRQHVFWTGVLHSSCESKDVRLHNISSEGAMLNCDEDLVVGTAVVLELGGPAANAIQGRVRWCRSGQVGVQFDEPFDMRILADVLPVHDSRRVVAGYVKPDYLNSEGSADSPWAARTVGLRPEDLYDHD